MVHLSNLCTEIIEVTSADETAVCNLGSVNVGRLVHDGALDFERLGEIVQTAVRYLDRVIDINFYPTDAAKSSNRVWRPVGLGLMGLQDVFFKLRLPFDSDEARELSRRISEEIYYWALSTSVDLAKQFGAHPNFAETRVAAGKLQMDLWGVGVTDEARWDDLRERIATHGLRNSLLIAIAPTATIASISGCYECIEPQVSNLFQARDALGGVPADQPLPGARPTGPGAVDRRDAGVPQAVSGLAGRHHRHSRGDEAALPHRLGTSTTGPRRPRRRAGRLHRPEASR